MTEPGISPPVYESAAPDPPPAGETGPPKPPSLRHELGERFISLPTMDPMLRACVLLAIGLLVGGLILGLLKDADLPNARLSIAGANPIVISLPALVLILLCFGLAWCYGITGALYGPVLLRLVVFAVFALAMLDQGSAFWTSLWSGRGSALIGALALLALALTAHGLMTRGSGGRPLESTRERLMTAVVFALVATVEVIAWWASRGAALPGVFAVSFIFQLSVFAVLAYLFLSTSGADFAQVAGLIAAAASAKISARRSLSTAAGIALAVGLLVRAAVRLSGSLPAEILLAAAAAGVIGVVARRQRGALRRGRLPSWSALAAGLVVEAALTGGVLLVMLGGTAKPQVNWRLPPPTTVYHHASDPRFSIAIPPGWTTSYFPHAFSFVGTPTGVPAFAQVWEYQLTRPVTGPVSHSELGALLYRFEVARFGSTLTLNPASDPRRFGIAISPPGRQPLQGWVTGSVSATQLWVVQAISPSWLWPYFSPVAAAIVGSWRPDLRAQPVVLASSAGGPNAAGQFGAIALGVAVLLAFALLALPMRPWFAFTGLLLLGSMLFGALTDLRQVVALVAGHRVQDVPHLSIGGIEATVAIAILMLAVSTGSTRLPGMKRWSAALLPLAALALVLLLLDFLLDVYSGAASAHTLLSVASVTFLLAGFGWDVALSGDLTNSEGRRLRRPARVLIYMGYMLAATAAVLYFGSAHELGPWAVHDYFFDPDSQTALSLGLVGVSYAVVVCIGRLASLGGADEPALGDTAVLAAKTSDPAPHAAGSLAAIDESSQGAD